MSRLAPIVTLATLLLAAPAFAGGYAAPAHPPQAPTAPPPPPAQDWTGAYVGVTFDFIADGEASNGALTAELDGQLIGIFGGYRYDFGDLVLGGELDYLLGSGEVEFLDVTGDADYELFRAGVELGYDLGDALPYATLGYAYLEVDGGAPADSGGYYAGVGFDYRVAPSITLGAELLYHEFSDWSDGTDDAEVTTFGVNVAFTF